MSVAEADNANGDGGGAATFSVWLSNRPIADVFVVVRSLFGQARVNATETARGHHDDDEFMRSYDVDDDGGGFTVVGPFDATNWAEPRTVAVSAVDDDAAEWTRGDSLLEAVPAAQRYAGQNGDDVLVLVGASAQDARYAGLPAAGNVTVLVADDDAAGVQLRYPYAAAAAATHAYAEAGDAALAVAATEGSAEASEGLGVSYGVRLLSRPFGEVVLRVGVTHSDHRWLNANASAAFAAAPLLLVFTASNWDVAQRVSVLVHDDAVARPNDAFEVTLAHSALSESADPAYRALAEADDAPELALTVTDDDVAGLFFSATKLFLGCDFDGNVMFGETYTLALTSQPTHSVEVYLSAFDAVTMVASHETHIGVRRFVFTRADWATERPVVVNATSTLLNKRSEQLYHAVASLDPVYGDAAAGGVAAVSARDR